jgi:hypothetical protein
MLIYEQFDCEWWMIVQYGIHDYLCIIWAIICVQMILQIFLMFFCGEIIL